jgi:cell division protein DivIC
MIKLKVFNKIPPVFRNKYFLTIFIFFLWLLLFDANSLLDKFRALKDLRLLEKDKEYFLNRVQEDKRKLNELRTNNDNLEKFAREQYHMKRPDEDLYIIVSPSENRKINRGNN